MAVMLQTGQIMDVEQSMVETTIEATTAGPPMGVVSTDTMMTTATVTIGVMTAMDIVVKVGTIAAEEGYTSVV